MAQSKNQPILSLDRFFTGLYTRRNPLFTPFRSVGINVVQFHDALIDGLNVEVSDNYTLQRRPGFPVWCTQAFGSNEFPLAFYSVRDLGGTVHPLVDTQLALYQFSPSALTSIFTKTTTAQGYVQQVGNKTYYSNGTDLIKWDGTRTTFIGTPAPVNAPTLTVPASSSSASATFWQPSTTYGLSTLVDSNGNFQQPAVGGTSGFTVPLWNTLLGSITRDGSINWINLGPYTQAWPASTVILYGTALIDTHGNIQQTTAFSTGQTTGATPPVWNVTPGGTTADNTVTWINRGPGSAIAQFGYQWVYAYRTIYGHLSTASPATVSTLPVIDTTLSFALSGVGTSDPQCANVTAAIANVTISGNILTIGTVNRYVPGLSVSFTGLTTATFLNGQTVQILSATGSNFTAFFQHANYALAGDTGTVNFQSVELYRIADGGSIYYFTASAVNGGGGVAWNITDTTADQNLQLQVIAPIAHANDPPPGRTGSLVPIGGTIVCWWQGRLWMVSGNFVYFDAGPDCLNGIPEESWPPANVFGYPGPVTGLAPTTQGLVVMTSDRWFVILGGPQTLTFYSQPLLQNFGLSTPNALAQDGDQIYLFNTAQQYFSVSANGKSEDGWRVGDLLKLNFPAGSTYLAMHRAGEDTGIFLSNGGALASVETSPGVYTLVLGPTVGNQNILARNPSVFSDGFGEPLPTYCGTA